MNFVDFFTDWEKYELRGFFLLFSMPAVIEGGMKEGGGGRYAREETSSTRSRK